MNEKPDFDFTFEHEGNFYTAGVWHYSQLTIKEKLDYGITENTYIIFLKGPYQFKPFEIYIGEDLEWHTKSSFVVNDEIVQIIGLKIHNKSV